MPRRERDPAGAGLEVYLLDVGREIYGDCILCRHGGRTVLIDGSHPADYRSRRGTPSIPDQLAQLLGHGPPFQFSLLVVTHAHLDHIGCLPTLVEEQVLGADWALVADEKLGFGRPSDDARARDALADAPLIRRKLVAALREENRSDVADDAELESFLADAERLEDRYVRMLETLESRGTKLVRYGRDDHTELVAAFRDLGLRVLGPDPDQLVICAESISRFSDEVDAAARARLTGDAPLDDVALYRELAGPVEDGPSDARGRPSRGAAVNNQSIILRLAAGDAKVLLTGDMQLAEPQVRGLDELMRHLRQVIVDDGPYDFFKLPHHGSDNGFDQELIDRVVKNAVAISGGTGDPAHPHPGVLELLEERGSNVTWARTDRNGLISVLISRPDEVTMNPSRGELNDPTPNTQDAAVGTESSGGEAPAVVATTASGPLTTGAGDVVEVIARVPHTATRVTLTITIEPGRGATSPVVATSEPEPLGGESDSGRRTTTRSSGLQIGGGRRLPPLMFATNRAALARKIGADATDRLLNAITASGQTCFDALPAGRRALAQASRALRQQIRSGIEGVVLLGGYGVVAPQLIDVLDPHLREQVGHRNDDIDDFYVWSDEIYGDLDGDGLPELPVTRIPDGGSAELVFAAIQATRPPATAGYSSVINRNRPFAQKLLSLLPGSGTKLTSDPTIPRTIPAGRLKTGAVYFMLHGTYTDETQFWGEKADGHQLVAVNLTNIPETTPSVIFTGCCWGALTVDTPAFDVRESNSRVTDLKEEESVALTFLRRGALAYLGCTGSHYSPDEEPYQYFGGPMHRAFWQNYTGGKAPARALFDAKVTFISGMPHGRTDSFDRAVENKILRQYHCLGLGW
jgi:beta-lactamase superfamily II metal-dependent hydrolase